MIDKLDTILAALETLRLAALPEESEIHEEIEHTLTAAGIAHVHEYKLAPGCRIDFFCSGIGIEVKKGRPIAARLIAQLKRYADSGMLDAIIVITQRECPLPASIAGCQTRLLTINRLWGVALP